VLDSVQKSKTTDNGGEKMGIIMATVKGDIHDIGKNIVSTLLSNYGFEVYDLGKDVSPQDILNLALEKQVKMVGLSALMTTTVPAMAETVALLKKNAPEIKVMVGGAVMTSDYAKEMGADFYGEDAMAAVKFATEVRGI
jgi:5-methyltetrahydrofolate--homocysteine methyltransferase